MATCLKALVPITALAPSATVVVAHGLNVGGYGRKPDEAKVDHGDLVVTATSAGTITVTNQGSSSATGRVLCEVWHSSDRVLGGPAALAGGTFVPATGGSGGGGSGVTDGALEMQPGGVQILTTNPSVDPSAGSGLAAPAGSLYLRDNGLLYTKTGPDDTAWTLVAGGSEDVVTIVNDTFTTAEDTPAVIDLFANDTGTWSVIDFRFPNPDPTSPPLTYGPSSTAVTIAGAGTIYIESDGTGLFTPAHNFNGAVPLMTVVAMGTGGIVRASTLAGTVTAVNDPPTARDVSGVSISGDPTTVDLFGAVSDVDGQSVTITHIGATPIVYNTPMSLTGGTITINNTTGFAVVTPADGRTDPITATYTASDGSLTSIGTITILIADPLNLPMISPVAPHNPANAHDAARVAFAPVGLQQYGALWPYLGPPDGEGNLSIVTIPPYSAGQGLFTLVDKEPWLYNCVRWCYLVWLATGDTTYRDVAIQWTVLYFANVVVDSNGRGTFTISGATGGTPDDVKYLYGENGYIYKQLTGSSVYYPQAVALAEQAYVGFPPEYNANNASLWTERHWAMAMRCQMHAFYATGGDTTYLDRATEYVQLLFDMSEATGAPEHTKTKHEGDADLTNITSAWMGALAVEEMVQYYRHTRDVNVLDWIYNYCVYVLDHGAYVADHTEEPEFAGMEGKRIIAYLFGTSVQFPEGTGADSRHSRDCASMFDKGVWAGTLRGYNTTGLATIRDELFDVALVDDDYWTRNSPFYPHRRFLPPRSKGWLWATFYALLYDLGSAPPIAPVSLSHGSISGSTQQGATLTFTPGTQRGTPTPDVHWVWQLAGVDITGTEDDLTYATAATGATRVAVTISNDAGTVSYNTNVITVVPAGAPEITVQPSAVAVLDGDDGVFTCSFTGIPDPTAVIQLNTGSGWTTTGRGSLDHNTVSGTTTATWTETFTSSDNGTLVRFHVSNGVGGAVDSDSAVISITSVQPAAVVSGLSAIVTITAALGTAGYVGFTWGGWIYMETKANNAQVTIFDGVAGRWAGLAHQNGGSQDLGIADSSAGTGPSWTTPPPLNQWLWITFRGVTAYPGTFTATYRVQGSSTTYTLTRANGIDAGSIPITATYFGGSGGGAGSTLRFQHPRGYNRRFTDQECIDEQFVIDPDNSNNPVYFGVARDDGGGGLEVVDASANAVSISVTNGTLSVDGPLTGTVS